MNTLNRRHFLTALGAAGALSLTAGKERAARASLPTSPLGRRSGKPLRFIGIYAPHGRAHELWAPREGFDIAYEDSILAPFDAPSAYGKSFKDQLVVLDG